MSAVEKIKEAHAAIARAHEQCAAAQAKAHEACEAFQLANTTANDALKIYTDALLAQEAEA